MAGTVPKLITQGLPIEWPTNYSPRGITTKAQIFLRGPSALTLDSGIVNGRLYFGATEDETKDLLPGLYFYEIRATTGASVEVLERGRLNVSVNLADVEGAFDGLSDNQKALQMINATLANRAKGGAPVRYRLNNRELYQESLTDLLALQRHYQVLVNAELLAESGAKPWNRKVRVSMK